MRVIAKTHGGNWKRAGSFIAVLLLACVFACTVAPSASAKQAAMLPEGSCTNQPQFAIQDTKLVSEIATGVTTTIKGQTTRIFTKVQSNYASVGRDMIIIYLIVYGTLFMFGAVPMSFHDVAVRMGKLSVVGMTIHGGGQMYNLLDSIFQDGTNELINIIGCTMSGNGCSGADAKLPLASMDYLVSNIVSPKMIVTLLTIATTGLYGPLLVLVLLASLKSLGQTILNGLWVFLMSTIVRALVIAVAPIFIPCVLFARTREFFQGWLNQLVNATLQPIFLMAFFAFFIGLLNVSITDIMSTPICMTPVNSVGVGAAINTYWWRFTKNGQLFTGDWGTEFPIDVFHIFLLFVLAELVGRFNNIIIGVANGIASATTNLGSMQGILNDWQPAAEGAVRTVSAPSEETKAAEARRAPTRQRTDLPGQTLQRKEKETPPDKGVGTKPKDSRTAQGHALAVRRAMERIRQKR